MRFVGTFVAITFCLCSLSELTSSIQAADPPKPGELVATELSQVDHDYHFQGEYMGYVSQQAGSSYVKKFGLQIVARGDGNFEAVLYGGGLPGDGWDKQLRLRSNGHTEAGVVSFDLNDYQITLTGNRAVFSDAQGRKLGSMTQYSRISSTMGRPAPGNAIVLFNGHKNNLWKDMRVTEDHLLQQGCETIQKYKDFQLHLEFRLPYKPFALGQARGNSGVYLQRRYEVQVLDSFGTDGLPNECGGLYKLVAPEQNMCLPPLQWQTYDIKFRMARFDDEGNKTENMRIRVVHNGVVIHNSIEVESKTGAGKPEGPEGMPFLLQDHGNPVSYRNIWLVKGDPFAKKNSGHGHPHHSHRVMHHPHRSQHNHYYYGYGGVPIFNPQVPQRMW